MVRILGILVLGLAISACAASKNEDRNAEVYNEAKVMDADTIRILNNVFVKDKTENTIAYDYKNVRIDEVALLAKQYCQSKKADDAVLVDAVLQQNLARKATFECVMVKYE